MKARLPWILFALSLALNIAFLGGAAWMHLTHPEGGWGMRDRANRIASELALDGEQRGALERFLRSVRQNARHLHEENAPVVEKAWREMINDDPDQAAVEAAFDEAAGNRRQFQRQSLEALRGFLTTLRPDQRARFIELVRHGRPGRRVVPWLG